MNERKYRIIISALPRAIIYHVSDYKKVTDRGIECIEFFDEDLPKEERKPIRATIGTFIIKEVA
jgi:hypothetical protein